MRTLYAGKSGIVFMGILVGLI